MFRYPPFACYDPAVGYDRKRTAHAPSGDQLGWIEYCRDQDEGDSTRMLLRFPRKRGENVEFPPWFVV